MTLRGTGPVRARPRLVDFQTGGYLPAPIVYNVPGTWYLVVQILLLCFHSISSTNQ